MIKVSNLIGVMNRKIRAINRRLGVIYRAKWLICRVCPIDKRKITISNFFGRGYGDNAKYIVEKLLATETDLKIIWLIKNEDEKESLPENVEPCISGTLLSIYHLSTSKIWIDNCRKSGVVFKRKNQFYIQTWHGFALKRIEKDVEGNLSKAYIKMAKKDSKNVDCIISCSRFMTEIYRNSFWYNKEILEVGAPRNDILLRLNGVQDIKDKVYRYFEISYDKKIILYAPTFRVDERTNVYALDYNRIVKACSRRFGGEYVVVIRLHPNISSKNVQMKWTTEVIDGTFYSDLQELMLVSSIVISDYSSLMFDFALTYSPCFQFATDIEEYKKDRNFYFDLDSLPFDLAVSNEELVLNIERFDEKSYVTKLDNFFDMVGMVREGNASQRCKEIIMEKCYS